MIERDARSRRTDADLAVFHAFAPPPSGGGHQFLRAVVAEIASRGLRVELNGVSSTTRACLLNSFNFDLARMRRFRRDGLRVVHRVDGPIEVYRGVADGSDGLIERMNQELAQATIFQSEYSRRAHEELGYSFVAPTVIRNAVDPGIFHPGSRTPLSGDRVRVIVASWSPNPSKGAAVYQWLDRHLDLGRYELTFVGQSPVPFERIRMIPPVDSVTLAGLLREHDIFLTASANDSCSNALIEGLACGLPALFLASGGSPEIVGAAGLPFAVAEEVPELLDRLVAEHAARRAAIAVPSLADVAERYIEVLGLAG